MASNTFFQQSIFRNLNVYDRHQAFRGGACEWGFQFGDYEVGEAQLLRGQLRRIHRLPYASRYQLSAREPNSVEGSLLFESYQITKPVWWLGKLSGNKALITSVVRTVIEEQELADKGIEAVLRRLRTQKASGEARQVGEEDYDRASHILTQGLLLQAIEATPAIEQNGVE